MKLIHLLVAANIIAFIATGFFHFIVLGSGLTIYYIKATPKCQEKDQ